MFAYYISLKIVFGRASFPHNGDIRVGFPGGGSLWSPELLSAARAAGCREALASPCWETAALGCGKRRPRAAGWRGLRGPRARLCGYPAVAVGDGASHFQGRTVDPRCAVTPWHPGPKHMLLNSKAFGTPHAPQTEPPLHDPPYSSTEARYTGEAPGREHCRSGQCPRPEDR